MSELNITEYTSLSKGIGHEPSLSSQSVDYESTAVRSKRLNDRTSFVRLISDDDCRIVFGQDPEVDPAVGTLLPSGTVEYFSIPPGRGVIISVVQT